MDLPELVTFDELDKELTKDVMFFGLTELSLAVNIHAYIRKHDITFDNFVIGAKHLLAYKRAMIRQEEEWRAMPFPDELICPKCKNRMLLQPIKDEKGKKNTKGWNCVIRCYNCGHEKFSVTPMKVKVRELRDSLAKKQRGKTDGNSI